MCKGAIEDQASLFYLNPILNYFFFSKKIVSTETNFFLWSQM